MGSAVIYRQEIIQDLTLFTSEPKARFYSDLSAHLDLSGFPDNISAAGRKSFSNRAKLRAAVNKSISPDRLPKSIQSVGGIILFSYSAGCYSALFLKNIAKIVLIGKIQHISNLLYRKRGILK